MMAAVQVQMTMVSRKTPASAHNPGRPGAADRGWRWRQRWGRAHARLVGEEAALDAVDHRLGDGIAHGAGTCLLDAERRLDDEGEDTRQLADVHEHHEQRHQDIGDRHEGHHQLGKAGDAANAAEDDETGEHHQGQTAHPVRDAEGDVHGQADGVGLHRVEHQTEGQQQAEGEDHPIQRMPRPRSM